MGASTSIQFKGKQQVIDAFTNRGVDVWAVFQGKTLLNKGEGVQELEAYLDLINRNESTAIYILKIYEDLDTPRKVKEKTEADGSFYFRLVDPNEKDGNYFSYRDATEQRFNELNEKFEQLLLRLDGANDEPDEEENSIGSIITGILQEPDKLEKLIGTFKGLFGIGQTLPAQIGNINILDSGNPFLSPSSTAGMTTPQQQQQPPANEQEKLSRLAVAIDTLEKFDSDLVPHLEKLAKIASTNPVQFKTLIGMLDVF